MTIKELIQELLEYPLDYEVIMSKDSEGNNFSPLRQLNDNIYVPDSSHSGLIFLMELDYDLIKAGYSEDDLYHGDDGQKAIVLWPKN